MKPTAKDILDRISAKWAEVLMETVAQTAEAHPELVFYIAGFHMFYADGERIRPPVVAMNDLKHLGHPMNRPWTNILLLNGDLTFSILRTS